MNEVIESFVLKNNLPFVEIFDKNLIVELNKKIWYDCPTYYKPFIEAVKIDFSEKKYNDKSIKDTIICTSLKTLYLYIKTDKWYCVDLEEIV